MQDSPKANVWCGFMCNMIIGPSHVADTWTCCTSKPFFCWNTCSQMLFFNTPLVDRCAASYECKNSKLLDRTRWSNGLDSTFPWHHTIGFLFVGLCSRQYLHHYSARPSRSPRLDCGSCWYHYSGNVAVDMRRTGLQIRYPTYHQRYSCRMLGVLCDWYLSVITP